MRGKQQDFRTEKYIRYGIRKFSFGAASVAIAVGLMFLGNGVVSAMEVPSAETAITTSTSSQGDKEMEKAEPKAETVETVKSETEKAATGVEPTASAQPGNEGTATGVAPTASAQPGNEGTATGVEQTASAQPGNEGTATGVAPTASAQPGNEGTATGVEQTASAQPGNEGTATGVAPTASAQPGNEGTATGVAPKTSAQPGNEGTATGVAPKTSAQPGNEGTATGVESTSKSSDSAGVQAETQKGTPTVPAGKANADGKTQYSSLPYAQTLNFSSTVQDKSTPDASGINLSATYTQANLPQQFKNDGMTGDTFWLYSGADLLKKNVSITKHWANAGSINGRNVDFHETFHDFVAQNNPGDDGIRDITVVDKKNPYLILISSNAVDNIDVYNANFQETFWFTYSNDGSIVDITKFDQAHAAQNNNQIFYFLSASLSSNNGVNSNRREYVQTNDAKTVVISKNPINDPSTGFTAPASTIGLTSVSGSNVPNGLVYTNTDPSGYQSHDGEDSNPDYYALQGGVAFANFTSNKPTLYLGAVPINASSAPWWWHGNHPWWWHGNHNKNSDAVSFISYNVVSNKKVNETIDYKNQSGEMVYDSHTQPVTFITVRAWNGSTSVYYKLGTQSEPTLDSYGKPDNSWSEGNQTTFPPVANPSILGYHVTNTTDPNGDLTQTTAQVVHSNDKDLKVTVTYAPNAEKANVTYIDDTTDNSKKIKSSLVSNHLEEKDNLENVALSSNSVQPATSISDDTYLKNLGIDINGLNINSVLKLASLFHIFANQASLSADTNGNLAVKTLNGSNDFGTRGDSYNLTSGDIYYIQQLAKNLQSNAFRNKTFNHVVLGKDVNVSIENNKVLINDITMNNLKPKDVYQDINGRTYINFSDVFQQLVKASTSYTSTPQTKDVISNYSDMNNRYVDVSKVATGTQIIYVNVPFKYLSAPQPITIKGISQEKNGPTIVINVTDIPNGDQNISTQVQLNYIDGTNALPNSEGHKEPNHVLWNLGTGGQTFNFSSGRFMGSILAPNATINAGVNIDGNIVANIVNITGGESHRWDIHPQPMKPAPTITTEKKTVNETIHYVYKDGSKAVDDHVAKPVEFTRQVSTDAVTGAKTYGAWSADQSFAAVTSPELKGYTADKAQIDKQTVNGDSKDLAFTVTYTKNAPTITTEKKTVNETIHDVYKDGSKAVDDHVAKPVEFTRQVSTDAVTGAKTYGAWSADQSFAAVTSPELKGYTADKAQIDKQTVNGDSKDLAFTVTYTKNAPTITTEKKTVNETIHYVYKDGSKAVDDHVAKPVEFTRQVSTDAVTGAKTYGAWSADQSFAAVTSPELKGYTADKAQIDKQTVNGDSKDLAFTVTYTKNAPTITTEKKTVNETIHYVYKDGSKAVDDHVAKPVEFTRQVSTDAVTGAKTYGAWSADQSFAAVTSPAIKGYTPDQAEIGSQTVNGDSKDLAFTVTYTKNAPTITTEKKTINETIHYVYKDGSKAVDDHVAKPVEFTRQVSTDAVTGAKTYGAWSADQSFAAVTSPELKGYTADKAQIDKQTVNGDSKDLAFTVTYTKNAPTITTEKKTVNETIHYVYKDGSKAVDDHVAKPVEFTRQVSTDAVTGAKTYGAWSADQSFAAVTSPAIKGYTPDQAEIGSQTVSGDSSDLDFTVVYAKNAPAITTESKTINETIHYVYKDGSKAVDDHVAKPVEFTRQVSTDAVTGAKTYGAWSADQSFAAVTSPAIKGYTPDQAEIGSQTVSGDSSDLDFTVVYAKNAPAITTESKTINETIHYVYKDGSKAVDDHVAKPVEFTRQVSTDAVTGAKTYGAWSADQSFAAVTSPAIKGYTPDQAEIGSQTVSGDSSDLDFTVVYAKNAPAITTESKTINETIHYVYKDGSKAVDDHVAKPVEFTRQVATDAVTGAKTYGAWSADQSFAAVTSPAIKGYTPDQAEIGSQTVSGDSSDLDFTLVYAKNAPTITTEKKTVNETIHYVYKDGSKAVDDHVAKPVEFTRQVSTDAVTGAKTYGAWSADQSFAAVTSPELKGYTADKAQIDKQTVNGDSKDLAFTVTYTKNAPTITTEKKTVNETIHYVYKDGSKAVDDHVAKPVEFTRQVSTDAVTGAKTYGAWSADQSFAAVTSPELKGYTADKAQIDKQTVNGDSKDLAFTVTYTKNAPTITTEKKTVNETIHYVYKDGSKAVDDHVAKPVEFTRQVSTDAVTGAKTYGAWSADQSFAAVTSPELKGYTADKAQIDKQTVNGDSKDLAFTVTYTKNAPTITTEKKTVNETIHYVYKDGSKAVDDHVAKPVEFTRQVSTDAVTGAKTYGAWSADQSFAAVTSPAIKGYTPDQAEIGSQTVSGDSSDLDFTVVYAKNAPAITTESKTINETIHYVYKDGSKAVDDHVAKPVEFTRQVSTDAVTGAKTYGAWSADQSFAAVTSPAIKGYTPDQAEIGSQTVSGDSSDLDFTVVYAKNAPAITTESKTINETIHYVYKDGSKAVDDHVAKPVEFTRQVSTDAVTGAKTYGAWSADQSFAAVTSPELKGYTADKAQIDKQTVNGDSSDLDFTVVYAKNAPAITTESKTINETIHYVYKDGTTAHDDYVAKPVEFTREVSTDAVTGEKTYGSWSADQSFAAVTSPAIKGYTPDQAEIGSQTVSGDSSDLDFTLVYAKNAPAITTESKTINETIHYVYKDGTTTPENPTEDTPITYVPVPQPVRPTDNGDNNGTPTTAAQPASPSTPQYMDGQRELPNTGTEDNASLAALGLLGVLSGFGLVARKKKED